MEEEGSYMGWGEKGEKEGEVLEHVSLWEDY